MSTANYGRMKTSVLDVLVQRDPMGLGDPENDLRAEYDSEAAEIARLVLRVASWDAGSVRSAVEAVFLDAFDEQIGSAMLDGIARGVMQEPAVSSMRGR